MSNRVIGLIIGATVAIIVAAAVLMPVINDAVDETRQYYNNEYTSMAKFVSEPTSIEYTSSGYYVNDELIDIEDYVYVAISDNFVILVTDGAVNINYYAESFVKANDCSEVSLTLVGNTATLTYVDSSSNTVNSVFDFAWAYYVDNSGDYRLFKVDQYNARTVYVNSIDDITAINYNVDGIYSLKNGAVTYNGVGTGSYYANLQNLNTTNEVFKLYVTSNVSTSEFYFENGDEKLVTQAFIVPYEVFGIKEGFAGADTLLLIIPVFVILSILVAVVAILYRSD